MVGRKGGTDCMTNALLFFITSSYSSHETLQEILHDRQLKEFLTVMIGQVSFLVIYLEMIQTDDTLQKHIRGGAGPWRPKLNCNYVPTLQLAPLLHNRWEMGEAEDVVATGLNVSWATMAMAFLPNDLLRVNHRRRRYRKSSSLHYNGQHLWCTSGNWSRFWKHWSWL